MRTNVYIDGFNLYYGCLKHSRHKWLDIYKLFEHILKVQSPKSSINKVKYFTADIKSKVASHGQEAQQAQNNYNRALERLYPKTIEIIKGYYSLDYAKLPRYKHPPSKSDQVEVWRLEEKQTDVNIALQVYRDAIKGDCDQIIIVSNDTDLEPALQMLRQDKGNLINIGIIIPIEKNTTKKARPANQRLSKYADWTRKHILEEELKLSQLPDMIPTNKKPIYKPDYW